MNAVTYLIYIIFWETLMWAGTGYAVFVLGASGWWFALTLPVACMAYKPLQWIHGKERP